MSHTKWSPHLWSWQSVFLSLSTITDCMHSLVTWAFSTQLGWGCRPWRWQGWCWPGGGGSSWTQCPEASVCEEREVTMLNPKKTDSDKTYPAVGHDTQSGLSSGTRNREVVCIWNMEHYTMPCPLICCYLHVYNGDSDWLSVNCALYPVLLSDHFSAMEKISLVNSLFCFHSLQLQKLWCNVCRNVYMTSCTVWNYCETR